ncbi:MAG: c-type cytochrome [Candidatus Thiodiazotropha weberae]|nr:c-type cytochrome [Candidatus Thiodiazotropha weberae]MCG7931509.1 c-type cytochrome [Candidatus Thiodiazotropha lotti]MCW4221356.1 c-type cytochrome [Candidatus Thiodiazotropha lotti]
MKMRQRIFVVFFLTLLLIHSPAMGKVEDAAGLYSQYCSVCHGDRGDGKSRARGSMIPPPRDFSSPQSSVELNRDRMINSITEGRPGTAMVGWKNQLTREQITAIVDYITITMMRPTTVEDGKQGRHLYAENCSVCHGDDGSGARWTLTNLKPPPRNFTVPGTADQLSRDHMLKVVSYGKADTAMPGFVSQLSDREISHVVAYVRQAFMSERGTRNDEIEDINIKIAQEMEKQLDQGLLGNASRGQQYYLQNCAACHGVKGDGKGPRAYFILPKPRNFQHDAARHTLNRPRLYTAIAEGTRGTDMPAWEKVLSAQQIADIVEYVYQAFIRPGASRIQSVNPASG